MPNIRSISTNVEVPKDLYHKKGWDHLLCSYFATLQQHVLSALGLSNRVLPDAADKYKVVVDVPEALEKTVNLIPLIPRKKNQLFTVFLKIRVSNFIDQVKKRKLMTLIYTMIWVKTGKKI